MFSNERRVPPLPLSVVRSVGSERVVDIVEERGTSWISIYFGSGGEVTVTSDDRGASGGRRDMSDTLSFFSEYNLFLKNENLFALSEDILKGIVEFSLLNSVEPNKTVRNVPSRPILRAMYRLLGNPFCWGANIVVVANWAGYGIRSYQPIIFLAHT